MTELLAAPGHLPFAVALCVLLMLAALEIIGALFGASISAVFSGLFPDIDVSVNMHAPDLDTPPGMFRRCVAWVGIGRVPMVILIMIFLAVFSIGGLLLQSMMWKTTGFRLPVPVAVIPPVIASCFAMRLTGKIFEKILLKDHTNAVSSAGFVGCMAVIVLGNATRNSPAEGKVKDRFGKHHYIMIEPDNDNDTLSQGAEVLLIRQEGAVFYALINQDID